VDTLWSRLFLRNELERNLSRCHYRPLFELMLEDQGFKVTTARARRLQEQAEAYVTTQLRALTAPGLTPEQQKEQRKQVQEWLLAQAAQHFEQAPVLTGENLASLELLCERGQATAEQKLALAKNRFLQQFPSAVRVSGTQWVAIRDWQRQLRRVRTELDLSTREETYGLLLEFTKNHWIVREKPPQLAQFAAVRTICLKLGVRNTTDREVVIPEAVLADVPTWKLAFESELRYLFALPGNNPPHDRTSVVRMLNAILRQWSASKLGQASSKRGGSGPGRSREYTYKLVSLCGTSFDELLGQMTPRQYVSLEELERQLLQDTAVDDQLRRMAERGAPAPAITT
jgi:hypothetical protein